LKGIAIPGKTPGQRLVLFFLEKEMEWMPWFERAEVFGKLEDRHLTLILSLPDEREEIGIADIPEHKHIRLGCNVPLSSVLTGEGDDEYTLFPGHAQSRRLCSVIGISPVQVLWGFDLAKHKRKLRIVLRHGDMFLSQKIDGIGAQVNLTRFVFEKENDRHNENRAGSAPFGSLRSRFVCRLFISLFRESKKDAIGKTAILGSLTRDLSGRAGWKSQKNGARRRNGGKSERKTYEDDVVGPIGRKDRSAGCLSGI